MYRTRRRALLTSLLLPVGLLTGCISVQVQVSAATPTPKTSSALGDLHLRPQWTRPGGSGTIETLAWRPGKQEFASGSSSGQVRLWNLDGQATAALTVSGFVCGLSWSPDGAHLVATTVAGTVTFWPGQPDSASAPPLQKDRFSAVAWSPQDKVVAFGSGRSAVLLWRVSGGITPIPTDAETTSVTWSPDGGLITAGTRNGTVLAWDAEGHQQWSVRLRTGSAINALAWAVSANAVAAGDQAGGLYVLRRRDGQVIASASLPGGVNGLCWSPNGRILAASSQHLDITFVDATSLRTLFTIPVGYDVNDVLWSPDGSLIAAGADDHAIHTWAITPAQAGSAPIVPSTGYMSR
ncbi:MAG: WD40 repeat domain-containing protein [Chloroflexi bacterium]|nr:WD40 repeat domain-containing protein [Chloroflexota bacterium]